MMRRHLSEAEIAELCESGPRSSLEGHLGRCRRCRRVAAEHDWLVSELGTVLAGVASEAAVPQPRWQAVQERLRPGPRRTGRAWIVLAAGAALTVCLMVAAPARFVRGSGPQMQGPGLETARPPQEIGVHRTGTSLERSQTVSPVPTALLGGTGASLPFTPRPTSTGIEG